MLISLGIPIKEMPTIQLNMNNESAISSIEGILSEKQKTKLNKINRPCTKSKQDSVNFNACSKKYFASVLKDKIKCTIPGLKWFFCVNKKSYIDLFIGQTGDPLSNLETCKFKNNGVGKRFEFKCFH